MDTKLPGSGRYAITYQINGGRTVRAVLETPPEEFWADFREAYAKDALIILRGSFPQVAFPARQVLNVELRPATSPQEA